MGRRRALVLVAVMALGTAQARAARVGIVRPPGASPASTEIVSRLQGELLSVGLEVAFAAPGAVREPDGASARAGLEQLARRQAMDVILDVVGDPPWAVDIWVFDRQSNRPSVARVAVDPRAENASQRLSIRSIDVLRSILIENHLVEARPDVPPAAGPAVPGVTAVARPGRLAIEVGAGLLTSLDGVGPAVLPIVRLRWAAFSRLGVQAELAGFGTRPAVGAAGGSARVSQQYALVGACACGGPGGRLRPTLALAAGALHTVADGDASAPLQAHSADTWSFLLAASAGARLAIGDRLYLAVAVAAQVAQPYVAVRLAEAVAASTGRPNVLVSATVGGWP